LFWNNGEIPVSLNYDFCKRFLPLLNLPLFSFGFIAPFAIVGFIFAIRQKSREASLVALFIFVYMISLIFFYISSRYRFPCIPFIIIFAAYAIQNFIGLIKTERKKECALFVLLLIGLFFITNSGAATDNSKDTAAVSHNNLGNVYYDRGMWEKAITEYKEAIEQEPGYAEAHFNLGIAYFNKNLEAEAMAEFQSAVRINPAYAEAHNNLAVMYYKRKDMQRAKYHYNKALESGFEENPEFSKLLL
jgi:tetratricopeptide (TPR) repeat protein